MQRRTRSLLIALALLIVLGVALALVFKVVRPTPPRRIVMTTGAPGSAYVEYAERYRSILAEDGIDLVLEPSAGDRDNYARLNDPASEVSVGIVASGLTTTDESPGLVSLGTLFYEPIWAFYRATDGEPTFDTLRGKRWSTGPPGSLEHAAMQRLETLLGLGPDYSVDVPLEPNAVAAALRSGEVDAALLVTSADTPVIRTLLASPEVKVVDFKRAKAYVALYPMLTRLELPAGVGDLALNLPAHDVNLIAFEASLVVRRDLHPAIQALLLDAARRIHGGPGMLHPAGMFPAPRSIDLPISERALDYYKSGPPFLQRYLPFWLAVLIGQILVAAIPLIGVLYPALRLLPSAYAWTMNHRIYRLYGELKILEDEIASAGDAFDNQQIAARLSDLERRVMDLKVPTAYSRMLYTLREHLHLVREELDARR